MSNVFAPRSAAKVGGYRVVGMGRAWLATRTGIR